MPTREQKRVATKVWAVHGKPTLCAAARMCGFEGRLREAAEADGKVTLHTLDGISYITFNTACKYDKVMRWALGAMGNSKIDVTVYPKPEFDQLQLPAELLPAERLALASASASASASALASAPASAPASSQCARHTFDEFITDHSPGNLYIGNVVSAYPGFC